MEKQILGALRPRDPKFLFSFLDQITGPSLSTMSAPEPPPPVELAETEKVQAASSSTRSAASTDETKAADFDVQPQSKRKWYRNLNPLRLQKIPPVPSERTVSREYGASFFSVVSFQWMSPLMKVRCVPLDQNVVHDSLK